jgi:hypothetical protein
VCGAAFGPIYLLSWFRLKFILKLFQETKFKICLHSKKQQMTGGTRERTNHEKLVFAGHAYRRKELLGLLVS